MDEVTTMTDVQLLRAARTAAAPFRELYGRYAERIYSFHLRRTGNTDAAHDLTAETFARAHGSGGRASATTLKARPRRGCTGSRATCCSNRSGLESSSATRAGGSASPPISAVSATHSRRPRTTSWRGA